MSSEPHPGDKYIDSREVIETIEAIKALRDDESLGLDEEECDAEYLAELEALAEQAEGYAPDWRHGVQLILDAEFVNYAKEFADDIGAIDAKAAWPTGHIDWEAAAEDLQQDYTEVTFGGYSYWVR